MRGSIIAKDAGVWALSVFLAFVFLMAGVPKLAGVEAHVRHFSDWGYPDWFRLVVGAIETTAALLLLMPRLAFIGAAALAVIMAGATYTHVVRVPEEAGRAPFTLALLAFAIIVGVARWPHTRRAAPAPRVP